MIARAPLHDGTAATEEFTCPACKGRHQRFPDDGIVGGQGRSADSLRDGYVVVGWVIAALFVFGAIGALLIAIGSRP